MEKLVGLALSRFLSTYIKDFSAQQFKNWSLNDLQFKEDVIQELTGIPPNFKLVKVSCNKISTKIPWKKLGNEPIVFYVDRLYIEIEEPLEIAHRKPKPPTSSQSRGRSVGFIDRIIDNIKFEVNELELKIKTLGKDKGLKRPPCILIKVQDIKINSTNADWEIVELSKVHKVNEKGEVFMFKQIEIGRFSLSLLLSDNSYDDRVKVFDNFPLRIRIKSKKEYFRGPLLNYSITIDILDEFNLSIHQQEFKSLEDAIDSIFECFGREVPKSNEDVKQEETNLPQQKKENKNTQPSTQNKTLWGRFTGILGSYKNFYGSTQSSNDDAPDIYDESRETSSESINNEYNTSSNNNNEDQGDSDSEFYDCYEELEEIPEEKGTLVNDTEDVPFSEFKINILKGCINIYDYILQERKGIASLQFQSFSFHFIPEIFEKFRSLIDFKPTEVQDFLLTDNELKSSKINLSLESYKVSILNPGPEHHPDYYNLIERIDEKSKDKMIVLNFVKTFHPMNIGLTHRELSAYFDSIKINFDILVWENIYRFFFSSDKGKKFEQYLSDNFDYLIQEALSDQVHFKLISKEPIIIIPPYAGKYGSKPHLASKVAKFHTKLIVFRSVHQSDIPNVFNKALFTSKSFPFKDNDIQNCTDDDLIISKKFEMDFQDSFLEIMPTPESSSEKVIDSFDMQIYISRNELKNNVEGKPHLDVNINISDVNFTMNQSQYSYLLSFWGEKLAWDPHQITEEMKETIKMEKLLEAASGGALHLSSHEIKIDEPEDEGPPVLLRFNVHLGRTQIQFLETIVNKNVITDSSNGEVQHEIKYETIAKIDMPHITSIFEIQQDKNVLKFIIPSFTMQSPRHEDSPFSYLLTTFDQREKCVSVRMETYKVDPPIPSKMWVTLDSVQICWIYTTLARIQFFFSSDEIPPEFREEKVKAFIESYSFDQSPSLGMDWIVEFNSSELIMVETPDTPECSPMKLLHAKLSREGKSDKEIHYNFDGKTSFFTKMWKDKQFYRESLTKPFMMKVLYLYSYNDITKSWTTRIDMNIDQISINVSRNQLIMMQSILDNQLSDIRDVNTKRSSEQDKKDQPEITVRVLYNSFQFTAEKMKISLKHNGEVFSKIFLSDFVYSTENWSDIWEMNIEAGDMVISPRKSSFGQLNFLQRRQNLKQSWRKKIVDDIQRQNLRQSMKRKIVDDIQIIDENIERKLISICYMNKQDEYKGPVDPTKPWKSRWNIEIDPLEIIYDSELHTKFQDFFALMEEHKNLRKTYQILQSEINRIYGEEGVDPETIEKIIIKPESKVQKKDTYNGMAINIIIKHPAIYFLEHQDQEVLTLLELNASRVRFGNDVNVLKRQMEGLSQYELSSKRLKLLLHTVKIPNEEKVNSIFDNLIQTHVLLLPTNFNLEVHSKLLGASGSPFVHITVSLDSFHAKISLNRYKRLFDIANYYIQNLLQHLNSNTRNNEDSHEIHKLSIAKDEKKKIFIDKIIEVNVKTLKATIVSDYMEELDLIYVKMNDLVVYSSLYKNMTDISFGGRFEITLNNMNYVKGEERFLEEFSFSLKIKIDRSSRENTSSDLLLDYSKDDESNDDLIIDLDDESSSEEELYHNDSLLSVEFVGLSEIRFCINKETTRQLLEISKLYTEGVTDKSNDLHSHYQYIIFNNTEMTIECKQAKGKGKITIPPSQEKYFVFPDPSLPRHINVGITNWIKQDNAISLEDQKTQIIQMKYNENEKSTRNFIVHIESKGLKSYITISSTHYITNETDKVLKIKTINSSSSLKETIGEYIIEPKKKIPISCSDDWDIEYEVSFDEVWRHPKSLKIDKRQDTSELKFYNVDAGGDLMLLLTTKREQIDEQVFSINLIFSPPLIITNICTLPINYCFSSIYFAPNYEVYDDMSDDDMYNNNNQMGVIDALSDRPFYIDLESTNKIAFKLHEFDKWTPEIQFLIDKQRDVETSRHEFGEEEEKVTLNVTVSSRFDNLGKAITVYTPFVIVNSTDMLMFAKQPGSKKSYHIGPNQTIPFSWSRNGSKLLMVNFGNTAWSKPIQISDDTYHRIEVEIPDADLHYMFLMEIKTINDKIRVINFNSWLNIRNLTPYDLKFIMNYESLNSDSDDDSISINNDDSSSPNVITIPKSTSTKSSLCPKIIGLTLSEGLYHTELLTIGENLKSIIQLRSKLNQETIALDVDINSEENGLFLTVKENKDPPYIIYNNTPFGLNVKRLKVSPSSLGKIEINSDKLQEYLESKNHISSDIFYIGPHDSINMFDADQLDQGEVIQYQVSIFVPEDEPSAIKDQFDSDIDSPRSDYRKHKRTLSTSSSKGSDGLAPPDNVKKHRRNVSTSSKGSDPNEFTKTHRRNFSTATTGSNEDANIIFVSKGEKTSSGSKQTRRIAHFKQYFSSDREIWSEKFTFDNAQSGFLVNFHPNEEDGESDAMNKLHVSLRPQGKTVSLTFSLPDLDSGTVVAQESQSILLTITIPYVEIVLEDEIRRNEILSLNIMGLHAEYSKYSSTMQYFYLVFQDLEIDTLFSTAEYPVLFIVDKSELHNYRPNILEVLFEWNVRDNRIFAEYIGLRILPFILQLDGYILEALKEYSEMFFPPPSEVDNVIYLNDPSYKERSKMLKQLRKYTTFQKEQFIVEEEHKEEAIIFVGKFEIFPMKLTLSVGSNSLHFPVISEAHISLDSFIRSFIHDSPFGLAKSLGKYYMSLIWAEIYKIIGNIDAIASPVQNLLKIKRGVADFFVLPFESLVLDDTPGAFLIGFIKGTSSLLINTTDFLLTTLMKVTSSFSWLLQVVSLDSEYQIIKLNSSRNHPTNIIYGFGHGFYELGYSILNGLTGLFIQPYREFKNKKTIGLVFGIGKGLIGIIVKPVGGVFDFLSKTSEGALQTLGRGYIIQKQSIGRYKDSI